jgi:hypothetical protein
MPPRNVPKKPAPRSSNQKKTPPPPEKTEAVTLSDEEIEVFLREGRLDGRQNSELGDLDPDIWIKSRGWTPVEFLTHAMRNPFQQMGHRITSAKALLEYAHRKMPERLEIAGDLGVKHIDAAALAKLKPEELETLEKILEKMTP